ncbi:MAG: LemA family protein [Chlorobi bacterium]|nr:LemA family protein [Chlorobiota bacterium]
MKKYLPLIIGGIVILIVVSWYISGQNRLVEMEENVNAQWSQVENQYQRRLDLIPNLVETVKGYAAQESKIFTEVARLRSQVGSIQAGKEILDDPAAFAKFQKAQTELGGALSRLLVVAENYPELKSNENFLALQSQLEGTENRIAVARKRFNEAVQEYNTAIRRIPMSIIAALGGFKQKAYFSAQEGAEKAPGVSFE